MATLSIATVLAFTLLLTSCDSMNRRNQTSDQNGGSASGKVVSSDISEGGGSVDTAEVANDQMDQPPMKIVQNKAGGGGVLIAYQISGNRQMVPTNGCRLKLQNVSTSKTVFVAIKADQQSVYKELPAGRYFGTRLSCKTTKIWNLDSLFANGFEVQDGKVSYVGRILFDFSKDDLTDFRHATRSESRTAFEEARNTFTDEPNYISGFTQKPLANDLNAAETLEAFDVYAKGTNNAESVLKPLLAKLTTCSKTAAKQDPLRYGDLKYVATYKANKFVNLEKQDDQHALSDDIVNCVENSLRSYAPSVVGALEVQARF